MIFQKLPAGSLDNMVTGAPPATGTYAWFSHRLGEAGPTTKLFLSQLFQQKVEDMHLVQQVMLQKWKKVVLEMVIHLTI